MTWREIIAAVLEIVRLYNPVTWYKRRRAANAKAQRRVIPEDCAYYEIDEKGEKTGGPFCTSCYDSKGEKVRFIRAPRPPEHTGPSWAYVQCPQCQKVISSRPIGEYLNTH